MILERPEDEELCARLEITPVNQPAQSILDAIEGKYFERYSEAKAFIETLGG